MTDTSLVDLRVSLLRISEPDEVTETSRVTQEARIRGVTIDTQYPQNSRNCGDKCYIKFDNWTGAFAALYGSSPNTIEVIQHTVEVMGVLGHSKFSIIKEKMRQAGYPIRSDVMHKLDMLRNDLKNLQATGNELIKFAKDTQNTLDEVKEDLANDHN